MLWVLFKSFSIIILLASLVWAADQILGFWPAIGCALFAVVIGSDRIETYFQNQEDSENWRDI